jgi:hypothetical protein
MANKFTYSVQAVGPKNSIIVYNNEKIIYTGKPSAFAPVEGPGSLLDEAKAALINTYGPDINNITKVPSGGLNTTSLNVQSLSNNPSQSPINTSSAKNQVENLKQQQQAKVDDVKESINDKKKFLKEQLSAKNIKALLFSLLTPILLKFIRIENIAQTSLDLALSVLKKQLAKKGTLEVKGLTYTFTPYKTGDYVNFVNNFNKAKDNIDKSLKSLEETLAQLQNILTFLNIAVSALQAYLVVKRIIIYSKLATVTTDLASPSPVKVSAPTIFDLIQEEQKIKNIQDKISDYQLIITAVQTFIATFRASIDKIRNKTRQINIIINTPNIDPKSPATNLNVSLDEVINTVPDVEEYMDSFGKTFILQFISYPDESIQYQALDSFSRLKVAQTALSRTASKEQLLSEIKQILG